MRKSIMIIDDEPFRRKKIYDILKLTGEDIFSASSGQEAMQRIPREKPRLVLVNLFSEQVDGRVFVKKLRTYGMGKKIKVIGITSGDDAEDEIAIKIGADLALSSSFQPYKLLEVTAACLELQKIAIPEKQMKKRKEIVEEVVEDYKNNHIGSKSGQREALGVVLLLPGGADPLLALPDGKG